MAKKKSYDIIFMDISMPIMDGVEATHEILDYEEDEELPHVPIVALTANALKGDRERFLAEGLDEYTTKPLVKEEIIAILKKFLADKMTSADEIEVVKPAETAPKAPEESIRFDAEKMAEKKPKGDTIVVLKKSPLEGKIFSNLLAQLGYKVETANSVSDLANKLGESTAILFADYETDRLDPQEIRRMIEEKAPGAAFILMVDPSSQLSKEAEAACDEHIMNIINRDLVRLIVEKFMK
jgi:CheY-like chemotaxis protein